MNAMIYMYILIRKHKSPPLSVKKSELYMLDKQIDVRWGDVSQIEVELLLFETACRNGPYQIYHLLSGVDLPIKTNDYIHDFISKNKGKEFVGYARALSRDLEKRALYYNLFTKFYKPRNLILKLFFIMIRFVFEFIVNLFIKRTSDHELKKGCNWISITHDFCCYLTARKKSLLKKYHHTCACDEIFVQTLLWNSPYRNNIYTTRDEFEGCLRLIDWNRGNPYTWKIEDKDTIRKTDALLARKFDLEEYPDIISFIKDEFYRNND